MKGYIVVEAGNEEKAQGLVDLGGRGERIESRGWTVYETLEAAGKMKEEAIAAGIEKAIVREVEIKWVTVSRHDYAVLGTSGR